MSSYTDSRQANPSIDGGNADPYYVAPRPDTQGSFRRSESAGHLGITLPRHTHNPYSDNPHAATGNYSLVDAHRVNPERPVTSLLPPLEKALVMKMAEERAAKRERKEVVRKMHYSPGYAQETKSWATAMQAMKEEQEERQRQQMEGRRKHVWATMKLSVAAQAEMGHGGDLKVVTDLAARTKREAAEVRRRAMKKAAEKGRMEKGTYWNKHNANRFEEIMNEVLPTPRLPTPGQIEVYNSPRPSVLDSDEEDEEEVRLRHQYLTMPATELPTNRLSEARLMHTFDYSSLYASKEYASSAAVNVATPEAPTGMYAAIPALWESRTRVVSREGTSRSRQSSREGADTGSEVSPRRSRIRGSDLPPKSALSHFRPSQGVATASREPGTATDMRLALPIQLQQATPEAPKERFGMMPKNLPSTGNWQVVWAHPKNQPKASPPLKPLNETHHSQEEHFPAAPDADAALLGNTASTEAVAAAARPVDRDWDDPMRQTQKRGGQNKYSERWYEVDEDLQQKPTTADDVGPYYTLGELGRMERRYMSQTAKHGNPHVLNLAHTLFGKNQVAVLTELLIRHPAIKKLCIANNGLDDATVELLLEVLSSGQTGVATLTLNNNHLTWRTAEALLPLLYGLSSRQLKTRNPGQALHCHQLEVLNISENGIGDKGVKLLSGALQQQASKLHTLEIGHCGISEVGARSISEMMEFSSIKVLRLGWNMLGVKGAMHLSDGLRRSELQELSMPHCGLNDTGGAFVVNALKSHNTLTRVDLGMNNLSGGSCSVLAECIKHNKVLTHLNLRDNPLGLVGCRKLLQGMVANSSLQRVKMTGCSFLKFNRGNGDFNPNSPNGSYKLNLADPVDRQICMELIRLRDEQGPASWSGVKLDGRELSAGEHSGWPSALPEKGVLQLTFSWVKRPASKEDTALTDREFNVMWVNICGGGSDGSVTRGAQEVDDDLNREEDIADEWRLSLLGTLTIDCFFTAAQAAQVVASMRYKESMVEAGLLVYGRIMDPQNAKRLIREVMEPEQCARLYQRLGSLNLFNPRNPTGYYNLQLSHHAQYTVARRLLEMFQAEVDFRLNEFPLRITWNNCFLNGEPLPMEKLQHPYTIEFESRGSLSLSYTEQRPVPESAVPISTESFSVLVNILATRDDVDDPNELIAMVDNEDTATCMRVLRQFDTCPKSVYVSPERLLDLKLVVKNEAIIVQILRAFALDHYITSAQLVGLLSMVHSSSCRVEIVTAFWARITDRAKNFSDVMRFLKTDEANLLGKRIGYYAMLDLNRPSMHYKLRMYNKSELKVAKTLFQMAINKVLNTTSTHTYMKNLHVDEQRKQLVEGPNMWQVLTGNAPDGQEPKTTLEFDFDYPNMQMLTNAANLIKRNWQAHRRTKQYKRLRDQLLGPRGGFGAYRTLFPQPPAADQQ